MEKTANVELSRNELLFLIEVLHKSLEQSEGVGFETERHILDCYRSVDDKTIEMFYRQLLEKIKDTLKKTNSMNPLA